MALHIETYLVCDVCGLSYGIERRDLTGTEHRDMAKKEGWTYSANRDMCPHCRPKTKAGKPWKGNNSNQQNTSTHGTR